VALLLRIFKESGEATLSPAEPASAASERRDP